MIKFSSTIYDQTYSVDLHEEAAAWVERKASGLTARQETELKDWLAADARHARAFKEQDALWRMASRLRQQGQGEEFIREVKALAGWRAAKKRRRATAWAAASIAAAVVVLFFVRPFVQKTELDPASSVALLPDRRILPDGSVVELNSGAEIAVAFAQEIRAVRLLHGEALFQVAENPARPFVVTAAGVDVRAVGTAFSVALSPDQVNVLVTEGRVSVQRSAPAENTSLLIEPASIAPLPKPIYLSAGARLAIPASASALESTPQAVTPAQIDEALAWRSRRVEFTLTPLAKAMEFFNNQNSVRLVVGDDSLGELRLTGVFWTDDPQGFSRLVKETFGVRIEEGADGSIVFRK